MRVYYPTTVLVLYPVLATVAFPAAVIAGASGVMTVSGTVRSMETSAPIARAFVSIQATGNRTTTDADGFYSLTASSATGAVVVAATKGFYNASASLPDTTATLDLNLEPVSQDDDPTYRLMNPNECGICHPDQLNDWLASPMANAGINTWVHDTYDGSGTPGGAGGFVYVRDSDFADTNPNSECASCHQPESWLSAPFNRMETPGDPGYPSLAAQHGISCDICHKIADVDVDKIDYPGLHPDAVTFTRPQGPIRPQVQYGLLGDSNYTIPTVMRPSYQPQLVAEVCGTCHQDKNDIHEDGTFRGVTSEPTYIEWLESPYGDSESPMYATCLDCHMPFLGRETVCNVPFSAPIRDASTIRSHRIVGSGSAYLENAAQLDLQVEIVNDELRVQVDVTNSNTGHHLPTGVTIRNMILLVEAWRDWDGLPLEALDDQTIHELGGIGDPAQGYYAGLAGKLYAKVNHNAQGAGPTFFTDATGILFDNRIPALEKDTTYYTFGVPIGGGNLHVRARLIYRRSFRSLVDAKGWTQDGHGQPLEDIAPPHFGHLMEERETVASVCRTNLDGDGKVDSGEIFHLAEAWGQIGPSGWTPEDIDRDGAVNQRDLLAVFALWKSRCP